MNFLIACLLSLVQDPAPYYQPRDFYCYDEKGNAVGVKLQPKVFLRSDKLLFAQLSKFNGISDFEKIDNDRILVNFIEVGYEDFALSVLNELPKETLPVVVWKGQECIPTNIIIIETKSPVDGNLLRKRLSNFGKFTIDKFSEISPVIYEISISGLEMPTNIFVLANLIAEDSAYIRWARPVFQFIRDPIQVSMYVTSNGLDSLGDTRFLHLDVHIFDDKITLLKDLVPQLGEGEFTLDEDIWFWADKPIITETENDMERIVSFVWPFVYLNTGDFIFNEVKIPYSETRDNEKVEKTISVKNCKFQIGSVTKGVEPPITDIQPAREYLARTPDLNLIASVNANYWEIYRPLLAVASFCLAILFFYHLIVHFIKWIKLMREKNIAVCEDNLYWSNLLAAAKAPVADWKIKYQEIELRLRIALEHFRLDYGSSSLLNSITDELERVYRDECGPNSEDGEMLIENIKSFVLIQQRNGARQ